MFDQRKESLNRQAEYVESSHSPVQVESVPILQHQGEKSNVNTSFPKSLSIAEMLNLGKVVRQKTTGAEIFKFNLEDMTWPSVSEKIELVVEQKPFAAEGFQEVYKAKSGVISEYRPNVRAFFGS